VTVLVDTTIWSLALRRRSQNLSLEEKSLVEEWTRLVNSRQAVLAGPIRQEVLSGVRSEKMFETLQERLSSFRYLEILPGDYDQAARFFNLCRSHGITGSHVDMLLCALAHRNGVSIFSTDGDFPDYARHLPIHLHQPLAEAAN
jgi:predicted nucleic acid-binding protein